jgi:hypothetical protein
MRIADLIEAVARNYIWPRKIEKAFVRQRRDTNIPQVFEFACQCAWRLTTWSLWVDFRKCQTSTASPAEPSASYLAVPSPSGGQNMTLSHLRERPSGWERRAGKRDAPVRRQAHSRVWRLSSFLQRLRYWLRLDLGSGPRLLLCCELMLYLECNRIGVHLVRLGCGAENLSSVRLLAG